LNFFLFLIFLMNFLVPRVYSNNNQRYRGINKCEINRTNVNAHNLKKISNKNPKISITSLVKIRNKKINLAISEAKLKAKKKLIRFLQKENFDNQIISRFSNNSFNNDLRGVMVTQICIQNGEFLKLTLLINDKNISFKKKYKKFSY